MNKNYKQEIKKLEKERKWEDIYNLYGEDEYDRILNKAMYEEIKEVRGTFRAMLWRFKNIMLNMAKFIGIETGFAFLALTTVDSCDTYNIIKENKEVYESEINAYNQKISKYSEEIRNMNLSDIQIFMKVMDDMWHNIKGYADPEKDIIGYLELSIATEEGYGVCRNMASDVAKKLNEINPNWNARIMCVLVPEEMENLPIADIKRKNANKDEIIE